MQSRQVEYFPYQGSSRQSEKETPSLGTQVVHVCSCKEENHRFPQVGIWTFRHTAQRHLECVCYDSIPVGDNHCLVSVCLLFRGGPSDGDKNTITIPKDKETLINNIYDLNIETY